MEYLSPYLVAGFVFVLGLMIGSFLNVVIYRVPLGESIVLPGSRCPNCGVGIKPYDNVPVLSYALLGGKCRKCGAGISLVYPAVELLVAILFLLVFIKDANQFHLLDDHYMMVVPGQFWLTLIGDLLFVSFVVPLVFIDSRYKLLPDVLTYPGLALMLLFRLLAPDPWQLDRLPLWLGPILRHERTSALAGAVLGMLAGGGMLWLFRWCYKLIRNIEGMGLGDVKMMLMVGAFLGWQMTFLTILLGSMLGSLVGFAYIIARRGTMKMELPFGVFLGPASIVAFFVGHAIWDWYLALM